MVVVKSSQNNVDLSKLHPQSLYLGGKIRKKSLASIKH